MKKKPRSTKILALLLTALLILPAFTANAAALPSASVNDTYDTYFTDVYSQLTDKNHVYRTLTYHELDYLLNSNGTYVVLFGGAWSPDTQAVIGYINEVAKQYGITAIHNFDTRLDGKLVDIADTSNSPYSRRYVELVNQYLTNIDDHVKGSDTVSFIDNVISGRAPDQVTRTFEGTAAKIEIPFLFVYNKDHKNGNDSAPIISSLEKIDSLLTNGAVDLTKVDAYKAEVKAVFEGITGKADVLQNKDYIISSYNEFAETTIFDEADGEIVLDPVTYDELIHILNSEGNYAFIFGCSWCGNTRAAIKFVNQYAKKYNIDKVYNWDAKLDGGIGGTPSVEPGTDGTNFFHTRTTGHPYANLYVDLVNQYLPNIETLYAKDDNNVTYTDATGKEIVANKLQVPYVFLYNKDHKDAAGNSAPILGHVELMYSWANIQPDYEKDGQVGVNYNIYTAALDDLFSTLAGSLLQEAPTGLNGKAPTSAISNDGIITGTTTDLEYKRAEATQYVPVTDSSITGLAQGTYHVRYAAKEGYKVSPAVIFALNLEQAPPTGLTGTAPTSSANDDGQIIGGTGTLEYKLSKDEAFKVNTVSSDQTIKGLAAGTYNVRYAARNGYNASPAIDVIVSQSTAVTFADVPQTAWYYDAVTFLADKGIANAAVGNQFRPDAKVTNGQFVTLLFNAYGLDPDVNKAERLAITSGVGEQTLDPDQNISRQDLITILYNALNVIGKPLTATTNVTVSDFSDSSQIASYAQDAFKAFVESGVILGNNAKLNPRKDATRAEMAQVLYNLIAK